jgi:translation elongation factor EF-G
MPEPAKIRNVAVSGHRGTGKTSLVEALLFQTGKINRLWSVQAGTTVSDSADDEHERQLSISMSLEHTEWQDRKVNVIDVPGDPAFQEELRCAARVVEGALVTVSAVTQVHDGGRIDEGVPRRLDCVPARRSIDAAIRAERGLLSADFAVRRRHSTFP